MEGDPPLVALQNRAKAERELSEGKIKLHLSR